MYFVEAKDTHKAFQSIEILLHETFKLVFELIFNFCLAVYIQKLGVRSNDAKMIATARYKFMPLLFAFNHPIYQEIEYRDLKKQVLYPPEIKRFLDENMSKNLSWY